MFKIGLMLKIFYKRYICIYLYKFLVVFSFKVNFNKLFCRRIENNAYFYYLNIRFLFFDIFSNKFI